MLKSHPIGQLKLQFNLEKERNEDLGNDGSHAAENAIRITRALIGEGMDSMNGRY
jgi:hypothetical protein